MKQFSNSFLSFLGAVPESAFEPARSKQSVSTSSRKKQRSQNWAKRELVLDSVPAAGRDYSEN